MTDHILDFAHGFESGTNAQWRTLSDKALRGSNFEKTLVHHTEDGIKRGPLFTDGPKNSINNTAEIPHLAARPWHITSEIDHPEIEMANADILADLQGGVSAITLRLDPTGKQGIALRDRSDLQRLLSGVHTNLVPIALAPSAHNFAAAALLVQHFEAHADLADTHIGFGFTPDMSDTEKCANLANWIKHHAPHWKAFSINAVGVHEAGATQAQELAYMLSYTVQLIRNLQTHGFTIDEVLALMDVHLASDQDGHMGIVKMRAARMLWAKMAESFGASITTCILQATSARRMLSKMDPWSNMLRLGGATFGAICGGANYITTLPFTHPLGLATSFARRIARNQQILLMEESRLGQVNDPANGSYTHETLTYELSKTAWDIFQEMEKLGGWENAQTWFQTQIYQAHEKRMKKINNGETLLIGVNQFIKPDGRKAEIRPRPQIKIKTGAEINAASFATAMKQAKQGLLLPLKMQPSTFVPVRATEIPKGAAS